MYYTAWELFRQDPHWHWPLTYTTRIGYPLGENIALADPNPLFAVLLKPFSPVLPEPFQYFGIEVVLSHTLLFFFSMRLFRLILGPNLPAMLLCSLFFCIAPPLLWNTTRHFAVSNHWLLLAALLLYVQTQQPAPGTIRHAARRRINFRRSRTSTPISSKRSTWSGCPSIAAICSRTPRRRTSKC